MDNLFDLAHLFSNPEKERAEEEKYLTQVSEILSRPQSGPDAPTDKELLTRIEDMACFYSEFQLGEGYDDLIKRLSFTAMPLKSVDAGELKTAWKRFLGENKFYFIWPLNEGMAEWYVERKMVSHAIAVYEYMYSFFLSGELHNEVDGDEECTKEMIERCLTDLRHLCDQRNLPHRARHICEVIEDYYNIGYVSIEAYTNTLPSLHELNHASIGQQIESDRHETKNRLKKHEHRLLFSRLHPRTKYLVEEAELWSGDHWKNVAPFAAPLLWAQVIESEFHQKVFRLQKEGFQEILGKKAPNQQYGHTCRLGPIIEIFKKAGDNNIGLKMVLDAMYNGNFLVAPETISKLRTILDHRNQVAHVREQGEKVYTIEQCSDFLKEIRETGWVFKFLEALQRRDSLTA